MKKSRLAVILLLSSLFVISACNSGGGDKKDGQQVVGGVTMSESECTLIKGQQKQLTASVSVENPEFVWSSTRESVATVSGGLVTAVAAGETKIIAALKDNADVKGECIVTVVEDYFIQEETTIMIEATWNDTFGGIWKQAIDRLAKKEPLLTVDYVKYSGKYDQLKEDVLNNVVADTYPDVTIAYPDSVADFINANIQLKMDSYMNNEDYGWTEDEKEDFYQAYLAEGQNYSVPGTYSLPIAKSTEGMFYDSEKLIGISLASIDATINNGRALDANYLGSLTWEELFGKLCPALLQYRDSLPTDEEKTAFLDTSDPSWAVVGYDSDDNFFITLAEQYGYGYTSVNPNTGAGIIEFNNDGMKSLMKTLNNAYLNHYLTTHGILGSFTNTLSTENKALFTIGSTAGYSNQFSSKAPKEIDVVMIPQAAGRDSKVIQQGPSVAFLAHKVGGKTNKNRALGAWLFYKELTTVSGCISWATTTGYSPIRISVAGSDAFLKYSNPQAQPAKTVDRLGAKNAAYQAVAASYFFTSPVFKGSSEARTQVGGLLTKAVSNETPITDEELDDLFLAAYENTVMKM